MIKNRVKCSWEGYKTIKDNFEDWLFSKCKYPGDFIDNLDAIIWMYNNESDSIDENPIKSYIEARGLKILDKFKKYFD